MGHQGIPALCRHVNRVSRSTVHRSGHLFFLSHFFSLALPLSLSLSLPLFFHPSCLFLFTFPFCPSACTRPSRPLPLPPPSLPLFNKRRATFHLTFIRSCSISAVEIVFASLHYLNERSFSEARENAARKMRRARHNYLHSARPRLSPRIQWKGWGGFSAAGFQRLRARYRDPAGQRSSGTLGARVERGGGTVLGIGSGFGGRYIFM